MCTLGGGVTFSTETLPPPLAPAPTIREPGPRCQKQKKKSKQLSVNVGTLGGKVTCPGPCRRGEKWATDRTCGSVCTSALPAQPSLPWKGHSSGRGISVSGRGEKEEWEGPSPSVLVAPPYLAELKTTVLECSTRPP